MKNKTFNFTAKKLSPGTAEPYEASHKQSNHGTKEWADKTVNCCTGCSHDCLYCYAKGMAVRFKQVLPGQNMELWKRLI
jgi:DNA repair photolyase